MVGQLLVTLNRLHGKFFSVYLGFKREKESIKWRLPNFIFVREKVWIFGNREICVKAQEQEVDVYSFGVLLCEMCIRELPDTQKHEQQVRRVTKRVCRARVRMCLRSEPGIRPNMERIIGEVRGWSNSFRL